jgi:hypothetical protein
VLDKSANNVLSTVVGAAFCNNVAKGLGDGSEAIASFLHSGVFLVYIDRYAAII